MGGPVAEMEQHLDVSEPGERAVEEEDGAQEDDEACKDEFESTSKENSKQLRVHFPPDNRLACVKILPPLPKKETPFRKIKKKVCACCNGSLASSS